MKLCTDAMTHKKRKTLKHKDPKAAELKISVHCRRCAIYVMPREKTCNCRVEESKLTQHP